MTGGTVHDEVGRSKQEIPPGGSNQLPFDSSETRRNSNQDAVSDRFYPLTLPKFKHIVVRFLGPGSVTLQQFPLLAGAVH